MPQTRTNTRARTERRAAERNRQSPAVRRAPAVTDDRDPGSPRLTRADALWGAVCAIAAGVAFATTFSSHVALGDAPESVAGVKSLGILHAPGYPVYVLLAHAFGVVLPIGGWEQRVNLFSLVCAALAVAAVFVVARLLGADRAGSVIGALTLAVASSFWFNAGFAKYYPLSCLQVTAMCACVIAWRTYERRSLLIAGGVLAGLGAGISWQLTAIAVFALAAFLLVPRRRPSRRDLVTAIVAAFVVGVAVCIYVMIRASQNPTLNYDHASTVSRLWELLSAKDFNGNRTASGAGAGAAPGNVVQFSAILARDLGIGAVLFAAIGCYDLYRRARCDGAAFCAIAGLGNLVAVAAVAGRTKINGFFTGLVNGGQLVLVLVVLAVLAALGVSRALFELMARWNAPASQRYAATAALIGAIAAALVVPSLLTHHAVADHGGPALATDYGRQVLRELPRGAILLSAGTEFGAPVVEQQVVDGARPDVVVVGADQMDLEWYRADLVKRFHLDPGLVHSPPGNPVAAMVNAMRAKRPVYADAMSMLYGDALFGFQAQGLVGRIVGGTGPQPGPGAAEFATALRTDPPAPDLAHQRYANFPNTNLYTIYARAHVELAKQFALANDLDRAADELELALQFDLVHEDTTPIRKAREHAPDAKQLILGL